MFSCVVLLLLLLLDEKVIGCEKLLSNIVYKSSDEWTEPTAKTCCEQTVMDIGFNLIGLIMIKHQDNIADKHNAHFTGLWIMQYWSQKLNINQK